MRTLVNIKKHSPLLRSIVAIATMKQHGVECYFENAATAIALSYSRSEIINALKKDVTKTADTLFKVQPIINSIQKGVVTEFDSKNNSVEEVFGACYDGVKKITLSGVEFYTNRNNDYSKARIREDIFKSLFEIDIKQLNAVLKTLSKYEESKDDIEKAILYPSTILADEIIKKITDEDVKFGSFYSSMSEKDKEEFDVSFKRTSVTGVIQNSTYIDISGTKQRAKSHKPSEVKELEVLVKNELKYIEAVEIDGDGSVEKMIKLTKQIEELKLNVDVKFTLKARKLGNYKARGICYPSHLIVAEDVRDTSAIIHEIGHLIHLTRFEENKFVEYLIDKLTPMVVLGDDIPPSKHEYFLKPTEIVARACEIAALFAKEEGRLKIEDDDFEVIKSREFYTQNEGIYFNFTKFDELLKKELLALYKLFYETSPSETVESEYDNFVKIDTRYTRSKKELSFDELLRKELAKSKNAKKKLYALVTHSNIDLIFKNRGGADLVELSKTLLLNLKYWGAHKDSMTANDWAEVLNSKAGVLMYIFDLLKEQLSAKQWYEFLLEYSDKMANRVRSEICLTGFRAQFSMRLRKELDEMDTYQKFIKNKKEYLFWSICELMNEDDLRDMDLMFFVLEKDPSSILSIDANLISLELLKKYNWFVLEKLGEAHIHNRVAEDKDFMYRVFDVFGYSPYIASISGELRDDIELAKKAIEVNKTYSIYFNEGVKRELNPPIPEVKKEDVTPKTTPKPKKTRSKKSSKPRKETKTTSNQDFQKLINGGEIVDFERTDGKGVEKVLKIEDKIEDFKSFNAYLRKAKIGYYSRIAKGFILYQSYVETLPTDDKKKVDVTKIYDEDVLECFAAGSLF